MLELRLDCGGSRSRSSSRSRGSCDDAGGRYSEWGLRTLVDTERLGSREKLEATDPCMFYFMMT